MRPFRPSSVLSPIELDFLIQLCMYHWTAADRARIARALPYVYARLTDTRVQVDTDTDHVTIQASAEV